MFWLTRKWYPGMSPEEVYIHGRGNWRVGEHTRDKARIALIIAHQVVYGAYKIRGWEQGAPGARKWAFIGDEDADTQALLGCHVRSLEGTGSRPPNFRTFLSGWPAPGRGGRSAA